MNYVAYEINTSKIEGMEVVDGYFIKGQRASDLNWEWIAECDSMEQAIEKAFEYRAEAMQKTAYCPIYNNAGYAIEGSY